MFKKLERYILVLNKLGVIVNVEINNESFFKRTVSFRNKI